MRGKRSRRFRERMNCICEHSACVHIHDTRRHETQIICHSSLGPRDKEPKPINDWSCHLSMNTRLIFSSVVLCLTRSVGLSWRAAEISHNHNTDVSVSYSYDTTALCPPSLTVSCIYVSVYFVAFWPYIDVCGCIHFSGVHIFLKGKGQKWMRSASFISRVSADVP